MRAKNILIIEDELIIAEDIKRQIMRNGYQLAGIAKNFDRAKELLAQNEIDIALIDIVLRNSLDGIEIAQHIRDHYFIPIIFITSHADKNTVERAKRVSPNGYLVKPFDSDDLYAAIEIAIAGFSSNMGTTTSSTNNHEHSHIIKDSIFVKKDHYFVKIRFDELKWIKAERNYLELHCSDKKFLTRSTLKDILDKLPPDDFFQIHRSYAINLNYIDSLEFTHVILNGESLPIGRLYFDSLKALLGIKT